MPTRFWFFPMFWIGACAVAMLLQTSLLTNVPIPSVWLFGFVFCATAFAYAPVVPRSRRYLAWVMGLPSVLFFLSISRVQQLVALVPALIWLLYNDHYWLGLGLRRFPAVKPVAIALAWAVATVLLPVPPEHWAAALPLFWIRAAFVFTLALAYDLCDQSYDLYHGLDTLVLRLGPRMVRRLSAAVLLAAALGAWASALAGYCTWWAFAALLLSFGTAAQAIRYIPEQQHWGAGRKVAIDGLLIFQTVCVWLAVK